MARTSTGPKAEFQDLDLGDARLDRRVVTMARQVARRPGGRVTRVFDVPAEREGAFRLIENRAVSAAPIMRASGIELGATSTLGEVVLWIAEYGGYTGKRSGGPPGTIVIARALTEVTAAARAIAALRGRSG